MSIDDYSRTDQVALCGRIATGDTEAWEEFITNQYPVIFNMPNLWTGGYRYQEHDLADWFGYAYDRLYDGRRLGQFEGRSALKTYLYRRRTGVVYRLYLDWLRSRREEIPSEDLGETVVARDNPETEAHNRQLLRQVQQVSAELSPARRVAFLVPHFAEALGPGDYQYLAQLNQISEQQARQRVVEVVESATDDLLARLLYPPEELTAMEQPQLVELATNSGIKDAAKIQDPQLLLQRLEAKLNRLRINRLHSARRYARALFRRLLEEDSP